MAGLSALPSAAATAQSSARTTQSPPPASSFQKVTLNDRPGEPMSLAVLPDLRVLHTARTGEVRIHNPRTGLNTLAAEVPVYQHDEEGLQGIAIDPDFSRNRWVYLYYSPPLDTPVDDPSTPEVNEGDAPFEGTEADCAPLPRRAAPVPLQAGRRRARPRHRAADHRRAGRPRHLLPRRRPDRLRRPGQPVPVHRRRHQPVLLRRLRPARRPTRPQPGLRRPAQRRQHQRPARQAAAHPRRATAAATPSRGATCSARAPPQTRPEIYAMGLRNPFRFSVNRTQRRRLHGRLLTGHPRAEPARGPAGHGRWMLIRRARQLRLAVLRDARPALHRLRLRDRRVR